MTWYAVFNDTSGDLISTGSVIAVGSETEAEAISRLSMSDMGVLTLGGDPRGVLQVWNSTTRTFDPRTALPPHLDKQDFLALFSEIEREDMFDAARNHGTANVKKRLQAFLDWLKIVDVVDMGDAYVSTAVNGMETVGIIGAGRATVIMGAT